MPETTSRDLFRLRVIDTLSRTLSSVTHRDHREMANTLEATSCANLRDFAMFRPEDWWTALSKFQLIHLRGCYLMRRVPVLVAIFSMVAPFRPPG